jgi:ribosomal protein RSM22 (predicted rRNA methylase)
MIQTFANLPSDITDAISGILSQPENNNWMTSAQNLHAHYMQPEKDAGNYFIRDQSDVLAYLGLRVPSTYAQIYSALLQIRELLPAWKPKSLLDLGSGPGTGLWAAKTVWPSIATATSIDREEHFQSIGKEIIENTAFSVDVSWQNQNLMRSLENRISSTYDLVIIANVLNELTAPKRERLLKQAYAHCKGIMIIIEPGTPSGFQIIQTTAKDFSGNNSLIAPYVANSFVQSDEYWIHFSQKFIRPEFQRRLRQQMRNSPLMASDWEEAKYSYVAVGKISPKEEFWGRCIGSVTKQKGFLEVPILTQNEILHARIMKRHKKEYAFAKDLGWGQIITQSSYLNLSESNA